MTAAELGSAIIQLCEDNGWTATKAADFVDRHGIGISSKDLLEHQPFDLSPITNGNGIHHH